MVKIINNILLGVLFFFTLLSGCKDISSNKKMVALKKIDVFETYKGDSLKVIFSLMPGDKCSVGKEKIEKMFAYLEVTCLEKGHGWIILGDGYEIITTASEKQGKQ
jgi:hypothetical protein